MTAAKTEVGVVAVVDNLNGFIRGLGAMDVAIGNLASKAVEVGVEAIVKLGESLFALGEFSFEAAVDFESAFAGVIKTTDGLTDSTGNLTDAGANLQQQFRDLAKETPIAVEELLAIGEIGGQLGIAQEDLISFTNSIAAMGVATNLTTEDAATQFAQIANIMGTVEREGADAFSKLGSTIVALGNNFATNERDVANFASRIAGAGAIAGLTESDIFAIGAAFSSVGVQAEAGGTAVQKVLLSMNTALQTGGTDLETFAAAAGMTGDEFAKLFEEDASAAFSEFVSGLGAAGDDAIFILEELGLTDQRLTRAFLSLANSGDLLNRTLDLGSTAWEENSALANEAAQRYATTESQIQLMKNILNDLGITIGAAILPIFNDMLVAVKPFIEEFGGWLADKLPGIIQTATDFFNTNLLPTIITVAEWLKTNIPVAIQVLSGFWESTLLPALATVWEFINTSVIPIFTTVWNWLKQNLPSAIETLVGFWEGTLLPIFQTVGRFIEEFVVPAFNSLVEFFKTEGPGALETLKGIWNEVWGTIQSVTKTVVDWFIENLPLIQETGQVLADFWKNNIAPTLDNVWNILKAAFDLFLTGILSSAKIIMQLLTGDWEGAWETLKEMVSGIWENIKTIFSEFLEGISTLLGPALEKYKAWWLANWENFKTIISTVWTNIVTSITTFLERIKTFISTTIENIKATWQGIWDNVLTIATTIWTNIRDTILGFITGLFEQMGLDFDAMVERWRTILSDILLIAQTIWENIKTAILFKVTLLKEALAFIWQEITDKVTEVWNAIVAKVTEVAQSIFDAISLKIQELLDWLTPIWESIRDKVSEVWTEIVTVVTEKAQEIFDFVTEKVQSIFDWIVEKKDAIVSIGASIIQGLIDGVTSAAGGLIDAVTGAVEGAIAKAKELLGISSPSKVFAAFGADTMAGFTLGIQEMIPQVQNTIAAAVSVPSGPVMSAGNVMTTNVTNNFNTNVNGPTTGAAFQQTTLNTVNRALATGVG